MQITLKAARVNAGYTLTQASELLDISVNTLSRYENGKSFPSVNVVKRMVGLYAIPFDSINFLPVVTTK